MTLKQFITNNRDEIDQAIRRVRDRVPATASCTCCHSRTDHYHEGERINDGERREWILNDEGLYRWTRAEKVRI
jgi:hypothetical protein